MKTLTATYKGGRIIELSEEIMLPKDTAVLVIVTDKDDDETELTIALHQAAEMAFAKLWDNDEDEVWNEYLQTA